MIYYPQSGRNPDKLTVFASVTNKTPDESDYDVKRTFQPTNLSVNSQKDRYTNWFSEEYVYLSFITRQQQIKITVTGTLPMNQTKVEEVRTSNTVKKDLLPGPPESYGRKYQQIKDMIGVALKNENKKTEMRTMI